MIFNVIWTLFFYRAVASAAGNLPYESGAWISIGLGRLFAGLSPETLYVLETIGLILHIGVIMAFLVIVAYSKHLHIALAPINVSTKRLPQALGPLLPIESGGKPINFEDPGEDDIFGRGKIEDFTWKGMLDFSTCTECGRCQSQCPAWNTGKPLSPKLVIMDLRDHLFAKAPYLIGGGEAPAAQAAGDGARAGEARARRAGVRVRPGARLGPGAGGATAGRHRRAGRGHRPRRALVVHHLRGLRRAVPGRHRARRPHRGHAPLPGAGRVELPGRGRGDAAQPGEQGQPVGAEHPRAADWTKGLDFEVRCQRRCGELAPETEYLFWVGCAGAFDDDAKKTTRATAELLHQAGVSFAVLGEEETCTGDPARRMGNEFVFQMLAQQNVETLNEAFAGASRARRKIVATCAHCFNTLAKEYGQLGGHYEVVHHTQLLAQLVATASWCRSPGPMRTALRRCGGHLPRPVLPGPAQPGLQPAPRAARRFRVRS